MAVHRRDFLKFGGALVGLALFPHFGRAQERFITEPGSWRKFEIVTHIAVNKPTGRTQAWVPVPSVAQEEWSVPQGSDWKTNAKVAKLERDEPTGTEMVYFEWPEGETAPYATVSSHAETRDRLTDFTRPRKPKPLTGEDISRYTAPTVLIPQDPALHNLVATIVEKAKTDLGKAKAIYEWIVENRHCEKTAGRAADGAPLNCDRLNILYVAMARASGLPARNIFGVRVAPSQFGYESLGAAPERLAEAQHCRAEVWLDGYGWLPLDPADVRRAVSLETGNSGLEDAKIVSARVTLFGGWEGNWVPLNMAERVTLPESGLPPVPALRVPLVRTGTQMLDTQSRDQMAFTITAKELPA